MHKTHTFPTQKYKIGSIPTWYYCIMYSSQPEAKEEAQDLTYTNPQN
jgi:hypothetical protein